MEIVSQIARDYKLAQRKVKMWSKVKAVKIDNEKRIFEVNGTPLPNNCDYFSLEFDNGVWELNIRIIDKVDYKTLA